MTAPTAQTMPILNQNSIAGICNQLQSEIMRITVLLEMLTNGPNVPSGISNLASTMLSAWNSGTASATLLSDAAGIQAEVNTLVAAGTLSNNSKDIRVAECV